ncbi:MAG TPA: glycosyltransferase family A protein [Nitrososphaerales archaeon]|nr:glycosyltransferase family A protein [Nitrososphaerales archaeon]
MIAEPTGPLNGVNQSAEIKYSICITNHNTIETLRDSLESILNQIDNSFEVIVVDSLSNDGSEKVLVEYQQREKIKLITRKCSRGQGRQIALENSLGEYVISHMDMDDVYRRELLKLIAFYHAKCEGKVMVAISCPGNWTQNVTIGRRELIKKIGGWRDLQYGDDWDLWSRAALSSNYSWTVLPMSDMHKNRRSRSGFLKNLRFRFRKYRDGMRLGRDLFRKEEEVSLSQKGAKLLARISLVFFPSSLGEFNRNFKAADPAFFTS